MIFQIFLKVMGDLFLCFGIIGAFPVLLPHGYDFLWPAILCGAGTAVAVLLENSGYRRCRYCALLIPCFSFLMVTSWLDAALLTPAVVYTVILVIRGEFHLEYYSFRESFVRLLRLFGIFVVVIFLAQYLERMTQAWRITLNYAEPFRYGALFAASGVLLLRQLRMNAESGARSKGMDRLQLVLTVASIAGVLLAIAAAERLLTAYATSIIDTLLNILSLVISAPFVFLGWILNELLTSEDVVKFRQEELATVPTETKELAPLPQGDYIPPVEEAVEAYQPVWPVFVVLGIVMIVLLLAVRLYRSHGAATVQQQENEKIREEEKTSKKHSGSNRGKIRRYYRDFLRSQRNKGHRIDSSQTSKDILDTVASNTDMEAAAALREVYLLARYAEHRKITQEQVKAAKQLSRKSAK